MNTQRVAKKIYVTSCIFLALSSLTVFYGYAVMFANCLVFGKEGYVFIGAGILGCLFFFFIAIAVQSKAIPGKKNKQKGKVLSSQNSDEKFISIFNRR